MAETNVHTRELKSQNIFDIDGLVALVTGGGTGIGLMIAQGLAANGAKVYIGSRRDHVVHATSDKHSAGAPGQIIPLNLDVTDKKSIQDAVKEIETREGKLHVLVNNAGQSGPKSAFLRNEDAEEQKDPGTLGTALFDNETFEAWTDVFRVNTFSIFFTTNAFLGLLCKGTESRKGYSASVINITSMSGQITVSQDHYCRPVKMIPRDWVFSAYNASKAAATHLTKMMSAEFAHRKIKVRVNAIAPGVFPSEMTGAQGQQFDQEGVDKRGKGVSETPAGRGGSDHEMAATALYLVSPGGCFTNGQVITVDGGFTPVNPS